ncbi:TetR/AcrR family transcriptional regulator [Streptomyces albofaciens JCM 4342]|uniref:TetR/AcrR family transcriptional regulator n=1 Tax=Streptomyces albofaciens TaxID=66866 RepID=UPI000AFBA6DD|nr:TetR/AcrR family transcriptional regulator [Streptomyces albofaciens]KAA6213093.1 TetR/AcrR family transcriptional regulator [Streptomyces albofaciens JCM 4342]
MAADSRGLTPRKQPRQARAEATRQRILTAAAHVFAEYGYAAGTTNRIAERARVSIGSLYQYYPNKDAILVELLVRHLDAGAAAVAERLDGQLPDSLEETIRLFVRASVDNHQDDPQLLRVMAEQGPRTPELLDKVSRHHRARVASVQQLFERHPQVRVADTYVAARLTVASIELLVHQLLAAPDPLDVTRFENELVAMLSGYLTTER